MTTNAGNQYLRKIGLIVGNASNVLDLSQLEVEFVVRAGDFSIPTGAARKRKPVPKSPGRTNLPASRDFPVPEVS